MPTNAPLRQALGIDQPPAPAPVNPLALSPAQLAQIGKLADGARTALTLVRGTLTFMRNVLTDRSNALRAMAEQVFAEWARVVSFDGSSRAEWETNARSYLSPDIGVAYSRGIESFFFYFGVNFYFGPVNRRGPLSWRDDGLWTSLRKRLAVLMGIPFNALADDPNADQFGNAPVHLDGVIGGRPLLIGGGLRLTELIRVTGGSVIFRVRDPNPLITDSHVRRSAFVSVSVDWDLRNVFGPLLGTTPPASSIR